MQAASTALPRGRPLLQSQTVAAWQGRTHLLVSRPRQPWKRLAHSARSTERRRRAERDDCRCLDLEASGGKEQRSRTSVTLHEDSLPRHAQHSEESNSFTGSALQRTSPHLATFHTPLLPLPHSFLISHCPTSPRSHSHPLHFLVCHAPFTPHLLTTACHLLPSAARTVLALPS